MKILYYPVICAFYLLRFLIAALIFLLDVSSFLINDLLKNLESDSMDQFLVETPNRIKQYFQKPS